MIDPASTRRQTYGGPYGVLYETTHTVVGNQATYGTNTSGKQQKNNEVYLKNKNNKMATIAEVSQYLWRSAERKFTNEKTKN